MAAWDRMLAAVRAVSFLSLATIAFGCGDSGSEETGFVIDGDDDGGLRDAGRDSALGGTGGSGGADGGGGGSAAVDASSNDDDAGTEHVDPCPVYCENALAHCTGLNLLYPDEAACMQACDPMPPGDDGDTSGNSAWCRAYHAGEAASNPDLHCPHASESGGDGCGAPCEAYCDQVMAHCTGANEQFVDRTACETACATYPDGSWFDTTGNTVHCRIFQASFSAAADPDMHCEAAGETGGLSCF